MTDTTRTNHLNQQQAVNFGLVLDRAPAVTYFSTDITIPAMTIGAVNMPTPLVELNVPGDHIQFEELIVNFDVDEDLRNYKEIQRWMLEIGFPTDTDQYKWGSGLWNTSDGTLTILNSQKKGIADIVFENLWPTSLSSIMFSIANDNVVYAQCSVSFSYTKFQFKD